MANKTRKITIPRESPEKITLKEKQISEKTERQKANIISLNKVTEILQKQDTNAWRQAWQMAINVDNPKRNKLYQIYTDSLVDNHLEGCISQRKGFLKKKSFKIIDIKTQQEKPELTELFETIWFKNFINLATEAKYWGHSLIQFGDLLRSGNTLKFDNVELVPRNNVIPEFSSIIKDVNDDAKKGISYLSGSIANWCLEVGEKYDLGLLLKVSPQAISKRRMLSYWDNFGQIFGMPVRIGTTPSNDQAEIKALSDMLENMGSACWGLFPEGTKIEMIETGHYDTFNVYDKRIDRANSEISKAILNQTMTIDAGSSYSQSAVHLEIFKNVIDADADFLRDVINDKLIPFLIFHGFPLSGYRFNWDESIDYTPEQQINIEQMLLNNFEADDNVAKYFSEKYNIPVSKAKQTISNFNDKGEPDFFV
jgi:hypothetical protein